MGNLVSLVAVERSAENLESYIAKALELVSFQISPSTRSVVIKPNLCYYWDAYTGQTTDPRVVVGIIDCVRKKCGDDVNIKIAEADASAMRTKHVFKML